MKTWKHIRVSPVAGSLGAEVDGIALAHFDNEAFEEVRAAFLEYQVLFFRDQNLTRDDQKAFARRFGSLHIHPFEQQLKHEGHPEFIVFKSDRNFPFVSSVWHTDATFLAEPPFASILRCVVSRPSMAATRYGRACMQLTTRSLTTCSECSPI